MLDSSLALLHDWTGFYTLTGTAAATLIGLQFVAMSLSLTLQRNQPEKVLRMFVTPTLAHFALVMIISCVLIVPLPTILWLSILLAIASLAGLSLLVSQARNLLYAYKHSSLGRGRWLSYFVVPLIAYLLVIVASIYELFTTDAGLFILAGGVLLLLVVGIRNAWDMILYLASQQRELEGRGEG